MAPESEPAGDVSDDPVRRVDCEVAGRSVSALVWGETAPEMLLIHGRGQNAHTWDRAARPLARPLVAIDLPGHGRSDWREDHDYGAYPNAAAVGPVVQALADRPVTVVGMSLGGMTVIRLAARWPQLVRRRVVVDTTPANREGRGPLPPRQLGAVALLEGPEVFETFEEMVATVARTLPDRPIEAVRRGVERNCRRVGDGRWGWRYDRTLRPTPANRSDLRDDLAAVAVPSMLVRGGDSAGVLDTDVAEFVGRQPATRVELAAGAGHSVQGDRPEEFAALIANFVATT